MSTEHCATSPTLVHLWSYRLTFLLSGMALGAWAPLVPFARDRAGIEEAELGLLLLCFGLGSLLAMPLAGWLTTRNGCRFVALLGGLLICSMLPLLASLSSFTGLALALALFGAGLGSIDVAMNVQGLIVEQDHGRPLMSGFHGLFSLGGITSAVLMSLMLWGGLSPLPAVCVVVAIIAGLLLWHARHLLPHGADDPSAPFARPSTRVLVIGLLCFVALLVEGAMLDWSAVFLNTAHHVDTSIAGGAYAVFSLTMAAGRFCGDYLRARFGAVQVLIAGGVLVLIGFLMAVLLEPWPVFLFGFALIGIGLSNTFPVYCSVVGAQTAMPAGLAIATITAIGYTGILLGPALIGFAAHLLGLRVALLGVGALMLAQVLSARRMASE
ncbi:MFS transporter [Pseudomonas sp. NPDC087358]|uniref:MFS transporter n=1 Tax=Pseudomonas sp. NPDC087358 TaxID=3364439 RepID=UPI00384B826C